MLRWILVLGVTALVCVGAVASERGWEYFEYECFDGTKVSVELRDDRELIVLRVGDDEYELPHVQAASGMKYSDGKVTFWAQGGGAIVEVDGEVIQGGCVLVKSGADDERAPAATPVAATAAGGSAGAAGDGTGAATPSSEVPVSSLAVVSSHDVDVAGFNTALAGAVFVGETWPTDPVIVVLRYLGHYNVSDLSLVKHDVSGENPSATTITVIREGLLDDSVRAIWDEIALSRLGDGTWRIEEARRAYRCWRGEQTVSYEAEPCP